MSKLHLTLACGDYDRTRALKDGAIQPEGISLNYLALGPEEIFWRMLKFGDFDASEMSMSNYITELCRESPRFIAIPVFVSRVFRHASIYINTEAGIEGPQDLKGKKIGVPEYHMTACLWARGLLQHEYGVHPRDVYWYTGGQRQAGREDRIDFRPPAGVHIEPIPEGATLDKMLEEGRLDALISPRVPASMLHRSTKVRRLWPNYKEVEMDYYRRTGLFPIMHTIVVKRSVYERYPWVAPSLYKAFCEAKRKCLERIGDTGTLMCTLPWLIAELEVTQELMGEDYWPYGVEPNRKTLEAMTLYAYEQGLANKQLTVEELFSENTIKEAKV